jgi:hypothetical protein
MDSNTTHADAARLPATLMPLVYDPDTGRLYWLNEHNAIMNADLDTDTVLPTAAAQPAPPHGERLEVVRTLLADIAGYTGLPLYGSIGEPDGRGLDEYIAVWADNSLLAATPREAAEQAWRAMRHRGSIACVFQVVNRRTAERIEVDLLDDHPQDSSDDRPEDAATRP